MSWNTDQLKQNLGSVLQDIENNHHSATYRIQALEEFRNRAEAFMTRAEPFIKMMELVQAEKEETK